MLPGINQCVTGFAVIISFGIFSGCNNEQKNKTVQNVPKEYEVMQMAFSSAVVNQDYPATIQGIRNVEIRPKIDGYIDAIYVDEGAAVKKGQLLFRINAPQYEQNVRTAEANINIAKANVDAAQMQVNKVRPLVEKDIVSSYELESAQYTLQSKKAALAQANAELKNAQLNQSYTTIYSPSNGVMGLLPFKIGSLVSSNTVNPLTTVSDIKTIYAYFSINEKQGLDFFQHSKGNTVQQKLQTLPPVTLLLANGMPLPDAGKIETASGLINAQTGAINMRATFSNPDGLVHSGSSAVVRIPQGIDTALLVPQKATYQIQGKLFVYRVDNDNKVNSVEVIPQATTGQFFVIKEGLRPGDHIVADGIASLREGLLIKPIPAPLQLADINH
ncbi:MULTISPECIES: efflux RND transporter periplasmic adaptor subunit [Niastella]|uniref:Efflux RND transporter periplasmic adaptor subunit n=1 Tax=Niastella soli TaxID=2821487 RepID=A0ABS3YUI7_9BACT|nr:efflux RND transporter periplasmic adaptor subunit [Niastella soli]MBO9201560.1 efflux RND transporter periplasmic adaptor subunit [Niastella soli]